MNVVDEFGEKDLKSGEWIGFREEYKAFSYAVLTEMLPLTAEERKPIEADWTRERVRAYKKSLVAPAQQEEQDEAIPKKPGEDFPQYKGWKRHDLCKRLVTLEDENKKLKEQLAKYVELEDDLLSEKDAS